MQRIAYLFLLIGCFSATQALGAEPPSLEPALEPLRPLLGKTWKGEFKSSTPERPVVDVMHWERALNGKAIRMLHSVNDGAYGGEIVFMWDEKQQAIRYHYFTTAGFVTVGRLRVENGALHTHELVTGNAEGATEVRGISEFLPDGTFRVTTEYLTDGKWQAGREVTYREDPAAEVVFK